MRELQLPAASQDALLHQVLFTLLGFYNLAGIGRAPYRGLWLELSLSNSPFHPLPKWIFWHMHIFGFGLEGQQSQAASVALSHIQCQKLLSVEVALRGSNSINIKLVSTKLEEKNCQRLLLEIQIFSYTRLSRSFLNVNSKV